jgi:hypothetical protein
VIRKINTLPHAMLNVASVDPGRVDRDRQMADPPRDSALDNSILYYRLQERQGTAESRIFLTVPISRAHAHAGRRSVSLARHPFCYAYPGTSGHATLIDDSRRRSQDSSHRWRAK